CVAQVGDVGGGPEPARREASLVADRNRAGQEPPVLPIPSPKRKRVLPRPLLAKRLLEFLQCTRAMIRMNRAQVRVARDVVGIAPRVVDPALVEPENTAVALGHPRDLRDVVRHRPKPELTL